MHARFPHGVARVGGVDLARGKARVPQEAYYVSNAWYYANSGLDRDGDGVACESV
ncbi:MAG TPA: excalibur calcium-binding domain-containing protein [Propionibacteriaceae bacterium]|nr:excalibur calcium-binding domain-containing protein [Propionibacteriaceae bacterium]